jgi:membrane protein insertase Oxa1/YidC/SpoIIIJ
MDISSMMFWNILLTLVIAPAFWVFRSMIGEIKRIDILLNRTREDYATRSELKEDMQQVLQALHRVEDKLDRALGRPQ